MPKPHTPKGMLDAKRRAELRSSVPRGFSYAEEKIFKQALSDSPTERVNGIRNIKKISQEFQQRRLLENLAVDEESRVREAAMMALHELGFR